MDDGHVIDTLCWRVSEYNTETGESVYPGS
jgi:hypothetical protein